ncbi:unnamed protein product [Protopolystoma xenopodis]|uniref:Uncharacterized protein n=1 Tax=Protopolystoma xenopodis TaxID=117903 RepID=A0A3S5B2F8_9PLAT|nr:unnamed protein product [Protopolystoma xenopodis]
MHILLHPPNGGWATFHMRELKPTSSAKFRPNSVMSDNWEKGDPTFMGGCYDVQAHILNFDVKKCEWTISRSSQMHAQKCDST